MPAREIKVEILGDSSNFARAAQQAADTSQPLEGTWKNLQQEAANLGASMDKLSEKLDPNSGKFEAVADAAGSLEQVFIGTTDILGVLGEQFGVPLGPMEEWTHAAADVAGGIESTITGFTGLAEQFGPMVAKMGPAIASTWAYVTALLAQAAAFIAANAPMLIIIGTIALVAGGVLLLIKHWDEIVEKVPFLKAAIDPIVSFFTGTLIPAFVSVWEKGLKPVIDFVTDHWKEIGTLILLPFAPLILIATDGFGIRSKLIEGFNAVVGFVRDNWPIIASLILLPFAPIILLATDAFGIRSKFQEGLTAMKDFTTETIGQIVSFMYSSGEYIVKGLWNGITAWTGWLANNITGWASGIIDAAKGALHIKSPSKDFEYIGQMVVKGFANGLEDFSNVMTYWDDTLGKWVSEAVKTVGNAVSAVGVLVGSGAKGLPAMVAGAPAADLYANVPDYVKQLSPAAGGTKDLSTFMSQYQGGGQYGLLQVGNKKIGDPGPNGTVWNGMSYVQNSAQGYTGNLAGGTTQIFQLVVDGAVLAEAVNRQNARAY